jgi:hypothetical protein
MKNSSWDRNDFIANAPSQILARLTIGSKLSTPATSASERLPTSFRWDATVSDTSNTSTVFRQTKRATLSR